MSMVWLRIAAIYLLVAVLAGGIAYLGNQLGRKIGRSKMSVFGLRPRHTSVLITTLTGSLIAIVTLSLFALFSERVRALLAGIDRLERRMVQLQEEVKKLDILVLQGRIVYGVGEPILLGTLNPGLGSSPLRSQIVTALSMANTQAVLRNNQIAQQKQEGPLAPDTQLLEWNDSAIEELIKKLENQTEVSGIRIAAAQNCLYRDKVPVRLETLPVTRVFREGEEVAVRVVQPGQPQLLKEWYDFLDEMRTAALRKGMIPINDSLGGGLSPDDFDRLIVQFDKLKGAGKLVAIARRDLYQTSPLDVRIEVRPESLQEQGARGGRRLANRGGGRRR